MTAALRTVPVSSQSPLAAPRGADGAGRRPENRVHQQLEVVARRRVAAQVDAARRLQNPVHLHQPHDHHRQVLLHALAVCVSPEVLMTWTNAGCLSAISPIHATSRSDSVHVPLNAAPAAALPTWAA